MAKISSTQIFDHSFSVVYDTHLIYSGFFSADKLPHAVEHLNPIKESSTLAEEIYRWYTDDDASLPLPMQLQGTEFQTKVWSTLCDIPKGAVLNYSQVASIIDHPLAARAVGSACGKNPLTLIVPCHRVVGVGSLGGYLWGLNIKKSLLEFETRHVKSVV
jgi:O-6-methylguanine DNA methyltransferase